MTSHEILGFMSPALSAQLLNDLFTGNKQLYKTALAAAANARKVRPQFLERQPRVERDKAIIAVLSRPSLEEVAANLLRGWLIKQHTPMLCDFLDGLGIAHENGVVESLPDTVDDAKVQATIEAMLGKYPHEVVAVYLLAFSQMNDVRWAALDAALQNDKRLQLGG